MAYVIIFFLLGMVAIFIEFFIPGGVLGTVGALLMVVGLYFAYKEWGVSGLGVAVIIAVILGTGSFIASMHLVPRSKLGRILMQERSISDEEGYEAVDTALTELVGAEGVALTPLRPAGVAMINERRVDVVSSGFMIEKGTRVKVVEVEGNRVQVAVIPEEA